MKQKRVLRKIKFFLIVLVVISSVLYGINWYFTRDLSSLRSYKGPFYYTILNSKETAIIDSLERMDYKKVEIYKPIMGLLHPYGNNYYVVNLLTNKSTPNDEQSSFSKSLAKELYADVISNAFIFDIEYIYINHKFCKNDTLNCIEREYRFYKDSLEKWCGFKVEKIGSNQYHRIEQ